jgi:hypothetical protein
MGRTGRSRVKKRIIPRRIRASIWRNNERRLPSRRNLWGSEDDSIRKPEAYATSLIARIACALGTYRL